MNDILKTATEELKNKVMSDFKDIKVERSKHAESIIRNHIIFSMGAGMIPVPVVDIFAVSASQLDMIRQLCKVYDQDFLETQGKAIVSSLTTATLARIGAGSLAKMIPFVGSFVGGVTNAALAGASTYALGQVFKIHFETGGTILDFDTNRLKKLYNEQFEKGKKVAEELRKQQEAKKKSEQTTSPDAGITSSDKSAGFAQNDVARIKELAELRDAGIISEEEFDKMKKKIIDG
ncbi:MAG: DUF697 domain-containing protein [Saprospiraceae bacterium]|nr:MAG: DUF697 domain-containing protein [Saprospiraceae bacterium]